MKDDISRRGMLGVLGGLLAWACGRSAGAKAPPANLPASVPVSRATGEVVTYAYDSSRLEGMGAGSVSTYVYDARGRLVAQCQS